MTVYLLGAKRSPPDGENSTPEVQVDLPAPASFEVPSKDLRDPASLLSPQSNVLGPRPYRPKPVTQKMIDGARQQVQGDNRKLSLMRTERASLLLQVGILDRKVSHWEGAVHRGGKEVVVLLNRKKLPGSQARTGRYSSRGCKPSSASKGHTTSYWTPSRVTGSSSHPSRDRNQPEKPPRATHSSQQSCKVQADRHHPQEHDRDLHSLPVHPGREVAVLSALWIFWGPQHHS